jgi:predicted Zn-dependent protease
MKRLFKRTSRAILLSICILAGCSRNARYYLNKGTASVAGGKDSEAELSFLKAIQIDPQSGRAHLLLGQMYARQSKLREAHDEMEKAAGLLPDSTEANAGLADASLAIYLADTARPRAMYNEIDTAANRFFAKDAGSFDALRLKGDLALLDKQTDRAVEYLQKADRIKPFQANVVLPLVESLFGNNQPREAEDLALRFIDKDKTASQPYDALYLFYTTHDRMADAEKILLRKVDNNPGNASPRLQLAEHYIRLHKDDDAARTLRPLIDDPKTYPNGRLQAADFYYAAGKADDALALYRGGLNLKGDNSVYEKRLIEILTRQGKRDEAARLVGTALREHPADDDLKTSKAVLLADSGKPENVAAAMAIFQELVKAKPEDASRHMNIGRTALLSGDPDRAQPELAAALKLAPASNAARALLADIAIRRQDFTSALRYSSEVLRTEPENRPARQMRSASLLGLGRYQELQQELGRMSAAEAKSADGSFEAGSLSLAEGRAKEAEAEFRQSFAAGSGDVKAFQGIVEAEIAQKDFDRALRSVNEELAKKPDSDALRGLLAATALRTGDTKLAIEQYKLLIAKSPKAAGLYFGLGESYRAGGDYSDALAQFGTAHRLMPGSAAFETAIAGAQNLLDRKQEALESFRRALALQPQDPAIMNNLAFLLVETNGSLPDALKLAQAAVAKQPRQPAFTDTLGWIYQKSGQTDSALQIFNNLTQQYPHNPLYRYHLAVSLTQKGDRAKAKETLTAALGEKPSDKVTADIRQLLAKLN